MGDMYMLRVLNHMVQSKISTLRSNYNCHFWVFCEKSSFRP